MNFIACDGTWTSNADGVIACSGTLTVVAQNEIGHSAITIEDTVELTGLAMLLFATVFGVLAAKKALSI